MSDRFSRRHGYSGTTPPITIREGAPEGFRQAVVDAAYPVGLNPSAVREIICRILRQRPDSSNWSEWPNIAGEVESAIHQCEWYRVYDIAEEVHKALAERQLRRSADPDAYQGELNEAMTDLGIGWKMVEGRFETRGSPAFETTLLHAHATLASSGRQTAASEMREALKDLSRRPSADRTGAVQHGMAALECVARDLCGDPRPTLGQLLARFRDVLALPAPLDIAIEKTWGYASEVGRHLREGREPSRAEAELVVSLCASVCTYLLERASATTPGEVP